MPIALALALVIGIHVPTLHFYFFGDDFLVLGDIRSRAFPAYMRDVILLRDLTPNWRPLTMLVYWGEYSAFGENALAWRLVNLSLHVASVLMLYVLVLSMTKRVFVATAAALIFGVSASAVHTVTYITALPHVLSELFLITAIYSLYRYVESGERRAGWYWLAFLLYVAGFLANEGGVVIGAVLLVYYGTSSFLRHRDVLEFAMKMTPFAIAAALLVSGLSGCGCQGVEGGFYGVGWHIPRETWVYMSRLAYPVGAIPLEPTALEWAIGSVVAAFAIFFFIRGPHIARWAAVGAVICADAVRAGQTVDGDALHLHGDAVLRDHGRRRAGVRAPPHRAPEPLLCARPRGGRARRHRRPLRLADDPPDAALPATDRPLAVAAPMSCRSSTRPCLRVTRCTSSTTRALVEPLLAADLDDLRRARALRQGREHPGATLG